MKKLFKCVSLILSSLFLVVLASCGGSSSTANKAKELKLDQSKEEVVALMGEPDDGGSSNYIYYGSSIKSLMKEAKDLEKQQDSISDFSDLEKLMEKEAKLMQKIDSVEFEYAEISFDSDKVVQIFYNPKAKYEQEKKGLKQSSFEIVGDSPVVEYILDERKEDKNKYIVIPGNSKVSYKSLYSNESFFMGTISTANAKLEVSSNKFVAELPDYFDGSSKVKFDAVGKEVGKIDSTGTLVSLASSVDISYVPQDIANVTDSSILSRFETTKTVENGIIYEGYFFNRRMKIVGTENKNVNNLVVDEYTIIADGAFEGCTIKKATVPANCVSKLPLDKIEEVVISSGEIGKDAFKNAKELKKITLADQTTIFESSFEGCTNLTTVNCKEVNVIEANAFKNCESLERVELSHSLSSLGESAFENCKKLTLMIDRNFLGNIKEIPNNAFAGCESLTSIYISLVTKIGDNAFKGCTSLETVYISDKANVIGNSAFYGCSSLTSVTIPKTLTKISSNVFANCNSLSTIRFNGSESDWYQIEIEDSLLNPIYDADEIFVDCDKKGVLLTTIKLPSTYTVVDEKFNKFSYIETIVLPNSQLSFTNSFADFSNLKNIYYKGTIEKWLSLNFDSVNSNPLSVAENFYILDTNGNVDFDGNKYTLLKELVIPNSVEEIKANSFYGFNQLTSVVLPSTLKTIGADSFNKCSSLISVSIPESVNKIGRNAFKDCTSLTSFVLPVGLTKYDYVFLDNCPKLSSLYYNGSLDDWLNIQFVYGNCNPLSKVDSFYYLDSNGSFTYENKKYAYVTELVIPSTVKKINQNQFYGFKQLKSLILADSVETIEESAFANCYNLKEVYVNNKVTNIKEFVFDYCTSLNEVYYDGTVTEWLGITFENANAQPLRYASNFYIANENGSKEIAGKKFEVVDNYVLTKDNEARSSYLLNVIPNVELDSSFTEITNLTLSQAKSLKNLVLPKTITSVGSNAFASCTKLENVYYKGDIDDWCSLSFETTNSTPMAYAKKFFILDTNGNVEYNTNNYSLLKEVVVSNKITKIGKYQFYNFKSISIVTLPNTITEIGLSAFEDSSVEEIAIPSSVLTIGKSVFANCAKLRSVTLSSEITKIPEKAFYNNLSLTEISLPSKITTIDQNAFYGSGLYKVTIPDSVTLIDAYAFAYSRHLRTFYLGAGVTSIGYRAFESCIKLYELYNISNLPIKAGDQTYGGIASKCIVVNKDKTTRSIYAISNSGLIFATYNSSGSMTSHLIDYIGDDSDITLPNSYSYNGIVYNTYIVDTYAFDSDAKIEKVIIPESARRIHEKAFYECNNLRTVTIKSNKTIIDKKAFSSDKLLEMYGYDGMDFSEYTTLLLTHTSEAEPSLFSNDYYTISDGFEFVNINDKAYLIGYKGTETDITLPSSYTFKEKEVTNYSVIQYALYGNDNITSLTIPSNVLDIGDSAFAKCLNLSKVVFDPNCSVSALYAFDNSPIKVAYIPAELCNKINANTIEEIHIVSGKTVSGNSSTKISVLTFADTVEEIMYGFKSAKNLTGVILPNSIMKVSEDAFNYDNFELTSYENGWYLGSKDNPYIMLVKIADKSKTSFVLHSDTKIINAKAFMDAENLESITLSGKLVYVGNSAFKNCSSLTEMDLPDSVIYIGNSAFEGCSSLKSLTIPFVGVDKNASERNRGSFKDIFGLNSLSDLYEALKEVRITNDTKVFDFEGAKYIEKVVLSNEITAIDHRAFRNCSSLKEVAFSNAITSIGVDAFKGTSLENVYFNGSVADWCNIVFGTEYSNPMAYAKNFYILDVNGNKEFNGSRYSLLTDITIPTEITSIGNYQFYRFNNVTSVNVLNGVTTIGEKAFYGCSSLSNVTLPNSVISIGDYAFAYCTLFTNVNYSGKKSEWSSVTKGELVLFQSGDVTVTCSDGEVEFSD